MLPPLTLHSTSLTPHLAPLHSLRHALQTLLIPPPPFYYGPHTIHNDYFLHALPTLLSSSYSTLSALSVAATESTDDARRSCHHPTFTTIYIHRTLSHRATHSAQRLTDHAYQFRHLSRSSADTAAVFNAAETAFKEGRGVLGKLAAQHEQDAMQQRCSLRHADVNLREIDSLIKQARKEYHAAEAQLVFAICTGVFITPLRVIGIKGKDSARRVATAHKRKKRASAVVDRCLSDRAGMVAARAFEATSFVRQATRTAQTQYEMLVKDACVRRAIEQYAALRSLEATLSTIAASLEHLAQSCAEVASNTDNLCESKDDGEGYAQVDMLLVERWHTISIALRLFRSEQFDV